MMFLSAVWTLILTAPIYCSASIGEQIKSLQICSEQTPLYLGWPKSEYMFKKLILHLLPKNDNRLKFLCKLLHRPECDNSH